MMRSFLLGLVGLGLLAIPLCSNGASQQPAKTKMAQTKQSKSSEQRPLTASGNVTIVPVTLSGSTASSDTKPQFEKMYKDAVSVPGLLQFYRHKEELFCELSSTDLNQDFIIVISIAKGIGQLPLLTGWSWTWEQNGEDMIWQFRKVNDRIQIVRRNFRHQADSGTPEAKALNMTFSDSIIYSLPIEAKGPKGGDIVDLTSLFMSDMPRISSRALPGFSFARDRSNWAKIKGLKDNMELEVAATYSGYSSSEVSDTVMDPRGVTVNVHYSISKLAKTDYKPRLADERIGYFNTVIKNLSKNSDDGNFVRYINRWNLKKMESNEETSLVEKPIIFWLEKSIPIKYRKPIRDGILEWNKAFEKAGFYSAIEVRQQEENDTWDPEDINYNTIRWSNANIGLSIGPSRVNPLTGEILDADVILDIGFIHSWNRQFDLYSPKELARQMFGPFQVLGQEKKKSNSKSQELDSLIEEDRQWTPKKDESIFCSQQMGLAMTFFDVMTDPDLYEPNENSASSSVNEKRADLQNSDLNDEANTVGAKKDKSSAKKDKKVKSDKKSEKSGKKDKTDKADKKANNKSDKKSDKSDKTKIADKDIKSTDKTAKSADVKDPKAADKKTVASKTEKEDDSATSKAKREAELKKKMEQSRKKLIVQGLQHLACHEVGHTFGLRHNFKQSTLLTLEQINAHKPNSEFGYCGSVMDYAPANIMPNGSKQGDFYPTKLGQYDYQAILYGYKDFDKSTDSELPDLKAIASQQSKPEFNYSTDEDCYNSTIDPLVNTFDLGKNPLDYAKIRIKLADDIFKGLSDRVVQKGESYSKLTARFNVLVSVKANAIYLATRYIGGIHINRDFKGDPGERPPFVPVDPKEQRAAMALINQEVFGLDGFRIPKQFFNYLAPNRWRHWGSDIPDRYDMDINSELLELQTLFLDLLFSSTRLSHLADAEYRMKSNQTPFTTAEMLQSLSKTILQEFDKLDSGTFSVQKPAINIMRRNLQQAYVKKLTGLVGGGSVSSLVILLGGSSAKANDFNNIVRLELAEIKDRIDTVLDGNAKLDVYSRGHLLDLQNEIETTLTAIKTKR